MRSKGAEDHKKESAKNRNPFPGLRKGTLRRLFRETNTITPAATGKKIRRVRVSRLKKNKASPDMKGRVLGKPTNKYKTRVAVSIIPLSIAKSN